MFRVSSVQHNASAWVLAVQGSLDLANVRDLNDEVQALFNKGIYRIVLDLERVTFISSAGVGCLLQARDVVLKHGGHLLIAGTNPRIREVFDLLGITSFLRFAPDLGGALAQLEPSSAAAG